MNTFLGVVVVRHQDQILVVVVSALMSVYFCHYVIYELFFVHTLGRPWVTRTDTLDTYCSERICIRTRFHYVQ